MRISVSLHRSLTTACSVVLVTHVVSAQAPADSVVRLSLRGYMSMHPLRVETTGIVVGVATLAVFDDRIAHEVGELRAWSGPRARHVSQLTSSIGGYLPVAVGGTLALSGWAFHSDFTKNLGVDVTKSMVVSGLLTTVIKGTVGRARPRAFPDDADSYNPGRGFLDNNHASFPSGHASAAFAGATVLASELSRAHPRHAKWIRVGLFGAATAVGFSRMYENAHWASDVFAGAAIGTLSGLHVVHQREPKP